MTKTIRIILITSAVLCFTGVLLMGIGYATGGVEALSTESPKGIGKDGRLYEKDKEELPAFSKITVDITSSDFHILPSDDEKSYMEYSVYGNKKKDPVSYEVKNGELILKEEDITKGVHIHFTGLVDLIRMSSNPDRDKGITLYLPEKLMLENLQAKVKYGDMTIESCHSNNLGLALESGDLILKNVGADQALISLSSGDIQARSTELKNVKITDNYGDITFTDSSFSGLSADLDAGDVSLTKVKMAGDNRIGITTGDTVIELASPDPKDADWDISAGYGDLSLPDSLKSYSETGGQYEYQESRLLLRHNEQAETFIHIDSKSGDITVK